MLYVTWPVFEDEKEVWTDAIPNAARSLADVSSRIIEHMIFGEKGSVIYARARTSARDKETIAFDYAHSSVLAFNELHGCGLGVMEVAVNTKSVEGVVWHEENEPAARPASVQVAECDDESAVWIDPVSGKSNAGPVQTTRLITVEARTCQGLFRKKLIANSDGRCAVTGCSIEELLRASHVKPWSEFPKDRLDHHNGLLLAAHLDALFDKHLITFSKSGEMIVSPRLTGKGDVWGLGKPLRVSLHPEAERHMQHHRRVFKRKSLS